MTTWSMLTSLLTHIGQGRNACQCYIYVGANLGVEIGVNEKGAWL